TTTSNATSTAAKPCGSRCAWNCGHGVSSTTRRPPRTGVQHVHEAAAGDAPAVHAEHAAPVAGDGHPRPQPGEHHLHRRGHGGTHGRAAVPPAAAHRTDHP